MKTYEKRKEALIRAYKGIQNEYGEKMKDCDFKNAVDVAFLRGVFSSLNLTEVERKDMCKTLFPDEC